MAESTYSRVLTVSDLETTPRHSVVVRITHWVTTLSQRKQCTENRVLAVNRFSKKGGADGIQTR
jgi:hypothetical protein